MFTAVAVKNSDEGGSSYLKLEDGQSINGVFRGEVYQFYQHWPPGGEKIVSDKPFPGGSMRFKANFVVYENKRFIAKVFEFTATTNNALANLAKVCDIRKTKVMISRNGVGKKTQYTVLPVLNEPLTDEQIKKIEATELNVLNGQMSQTVLPKSHAPGAQDEKEF